MDEMDYKQYQEAYFSNLTGTSILEVPILLTTILVVGLLTMYSNVYLNYSASLAKSFISEFSLFVIPCILFVTIANDQFQFWLWLVLPFVLALCVYELIYRPGESISKALDWSINSKHRPYVTNFKAVITLITAVSILAVDFTIYPRKYAKTESYGYSLMDTGVGFYVVANGLTTHLNYQRGIMWKSFMSNLPILILGFVRCYTVEKVDYHKHVTEYGMHWNFFFTLALVKFIGACVITKTPRTFLTTTAFLIFHQTALAAGLESWVLGDTPRDSFLASNREGIVSLPGYLALFLGAVYLRQSLSPFEVSTVRKELTKAIRFIVCAILGFVIVYLISGRCPPSRRLANLTFVLWMFANCALVLGYSIILECFFVIISRRRRIDTFLDRTIYIFEAVNANNLFFFLLANLLTGAVNLTIQTLFVKPFLSLVIIFVYTAFLCGVICLIYNNKWKLKFW